MTKKSSHLESLGERYLLIDTDIHRTPESAGIFVLYGPHSVPIHVRSVSNLRTALLEAKRNYRSAVEFALLETEGTDEQHRSKLEKVLRTALSLREKRDQDLVTGEGSSDTPSP